MQPINILYIIKSLDVGGIEILTLDVCRNAHKHHLYAHVICIGDGELLESFSEARCHFKVIRKIPRPYDLIDPFLTTKLRSYIRRNKIDIVHAKFADEGVHAYLATVGLNVPLVQEVAVDLRLNRWLDNQKFIFLSNRAALNIAPTEVVLRQIEAYGMNRRRNGTSLHNGIDPDRLHQEESTIRQELSIPQSAIVAGMVGNFYNAVRDQLTICKALPNIIKKHPNFHFIFAGGSKNQWIKRDLNYFEECVKLCKEAGIEANVHFTGLRKDIGNILAGLDFYVHSTKYDTFGIAPVEAMFRGLPVIANDVPVFRETSHNGKGMLLFKSGNPERLTERMNQLVEDQTYRKQLAKDHLAHAQQHFSIDVHLQKLRNLYLQVLKKSKSG